MNKYICEDCMNKEYETKENEDTPFPAFTIVGGAIGAAASFLTGSFILIPVGLLAGAGTDVARCELCGSEENVHQIMSSEDDEEGQIYSPLDPGGNTGGKESFWSPEPNSTPKTRYRYNDMEEKLMPIEEVTPSPKSDFDWSIPSEKPIGKKTDITQKEPDENISPDTEKDVMPAVDSPTTAPSDQASSAGAEGVNVNSPTSPGGGE